MKVICNFKKEKNSNNTIIFPRNIKKDDYVINTPVYNLNRFECEYDIKIDTLYEVYGIMSYESKEYYLIICEYSLLPQWFPSHIFEIIDNRKPFTWVRNNDINECKSIDFIEGYELLANNYNHMIELIDKNDKDIQVFLREKELIDEISTFDIQ